MTSPAIRRYSQLLFSVNGDPDQMVDSADDSATGGNSSGPSSGQPHAAGGGKSAKSCRQPTSEASKLQGVLGGGELNFGSFRTTHGHHLHP